MKIKIKDVLNVSSDIRFLGNDRNLEKDVMYYELDSREITKENSEDNLYFAYKGKKVDGFSFVKYLIDLGLRSFVCSNEHEAECIEYLKKYENLIFLLTSDVVKFLQDLASYVIEKTSFKRIAITGSNGKTTTKEMLYSILSEKYKTYKTLRNLNSDIGLPLSILRVSGDEEYAVFEVGISYVGEMKILSRILRPEIIIITNISYAHMEEFVNLDGVALEKSKIITDSVEMVVLNENEYYYNFLKNKVFSFNSDARILNFEINGLIPKFFSFKDTNISCDFMYKGFSYSLHLPGRHNIINAVSCINLALALGLSEEEIRNGLLKTEFQKGRAELIRVNEYLILNDSYNGNWGSFLALRDMLLDFNIDLKKFIVLGAFKELGNFSYNTHKEVVEVATLMNFDKIFLIGDEFLSIENSEKLIDNNIHYFKEFDDFIKFFLEVLEKDTFVVLKGSRSNRLERIFDYI